MEHGVSHKSLSVNIKKYKESEVEEYQGVFWILKPDLPKANQVQGFSSHSFQNLIPIFSFITFKLFIDQGFRFIQQILNI